MLSTAPISSVKYSDSQKPHHWIHDHVFFFIPSPSVSFLQWTACLSSSIVVAVRQHAVWWTIYCLRGWSLLLVFSLFSQETSPQTMKSNQSQFNNTHMLPHCAWKGNGVTRWSIKFIPIVISPRHPHEAVVSDCELISNGGASTSTISPVITSWWVHHLKCGRLMPAGLNGEINEAVDRTGLFAVPPYIPWRVCLHAH